MVRARGRLPAEMRTGICLPELACLLPTSWLQSSKPSLPHACLLPLQELILFSRADLERSIPCMVDGLKPGQRKILFACFKRNLKSDVKVSQLSGYVAEHSGRCRGQAGAMPSTLPACAPSEEAASLAYTLALSGRA